MSLTKRFVHFLVLFSFFHVNVMSAWGQDIQRAQETDYQLTLQLMNPSTLSKRSLSEDETEETDSDPSSDTTLSLSLRQKLPPTEEKPSETYYKDYKVQLSLTSGLDSSSSMWTLKELGQGSQEMHELLTYFPWLKTLSVSTRGDMMVNNLTSDASFAFSSPQLIALKNIKASALYLQGKSVLIQDRLKTDSLSLETVTATSMDIGSVIETQNVTVFGGSIHNQGTLKSKANLKVNLLHHSLINPGTIEASEKVEIHQAQSMVNQGVLSSKNVSLFGDYGANSGVIKAETLEITTLQGLYNTSTGKIQTTSSARLVSLGALHNQGEITSQGLQKLVAQEELKNQGTLEAAHHQLKSFKVLENQGKILSTSSQEHQIEADTFRALSPSEISLPHLKVKSNTGQWRGIATHIQSQTLEIGKEFKLNSDLQLTTPHWIWTGDLKSTLETNTAEKGLRVQQIDTNSFRGQLKNTGTFVVPAQWRWGLIYQVLNQGKLILPKGRELFVQDLKNDREGIVEGEGDLKIGMGGGINRGLIQGEGLSVRILYGTLINENRLKLRHLEGSGKFENQGQLWMSKGESTIGVKEFINRTPEASMIEGEKDTPNKSQAMVGSETGSTVTFTTDVKSWLNDQGVIVVDQLVFASVPRETKLFQASHDDQTHFINKGLVQTKKLDFYRNYFDNEHTVETEELTFKYLNTGGYLTNRKGSTFRVKGKADLKMQKLINDGEIIYEGDLGGDIYDFTNQGHVEVKGATTLGGVIKTDYPSLLSTFTNTGTALFKGPAKFNKIKNQESLTFAQGVECGYFTNQGQTHSKGPARFIDLNNSKTLLCDKGLEVTDFKNIAGGSTQVQGKLQVKEDFYNKGALSLQEMQWGGALAFDNHGTLVLSGASLSKTPLSLNNYGQVKFNSPVKFSYLYNLGTLVAEKGLEADYFATNTNSSTHVKDHFTLNGKFENKGTLHLDSVTFKTNQPKLENEGRLLFDLVRGDLSHLFLTNNANGYFRSQWSHLRLRSFHNSGNYRWEKNPGQATAIIDNGLSVENFYNRCGTTEISGAVNISKSYINHGELLLKKGTFEYGGDTLVNNGTLRMEEITQEKSIPRVENKGTWSAVQSKLKVKEFHNENNLEVGLGLYEFDTFRNASKGLLTAHSRASLKADASLETVLKALLKAGPYSEMRMRFRSFTNYGMIQSPDSLAFSGNWNKHHLGTLKVKGTAEFNLYGHNVTSSLFRGVQAEGGIKLHARTFQTNSSVYTPNTGWELHLTKHFIVDHTLQLRSLKVWTRELFQIGRSNDDLAELTTTEGPLTISAHSIDARYGKIHGTGDVDLTAQEGDLLWGDAIAVPNGGSARHYQSYIGMMYQSFSSYKSNNSYLSSGQNLILRAWYGYLKGHFGLVSSGQNMTFSASEKDIQMTCCEMVSGKDITVQGQKWTYNRTAPTYCYFGNTEDICGRGGLKDMWSEGLTSDPTTLQCLGDLNLRVPAFSIVGNNLYVGGSIYKRYSSVKYLEEINISPQSYREYGARNCGFHTVYDKSGTVIAGKKIYLNRGHFHLRGSISATKIELTLTSLYAENTQKTRPVQDLSKPVQISFLTVAQDMAQQGGLIRQNSRGQLVPRIPFYKSSGKPLNRNHMLFEGFIPSTDVPFWVDEKLWRSVMLRGMAQYANTLSANGHSGSELFDHIEDNTKKTRAESGALITEDMINNPLCIVMYFSPYYQNYQLGLAPYLLIPAKDQGIAPGGGDLLALEELTTRTIGDQEHHSNREICQKGDINSYSGGRILDITDKWAETWSDGDTTVYREHAMPVKQTIARNGAINREANQGYLGRGAEKKARALKIKTQTGDLKEEPLILQNIVTHKEESSSWFSSSTKTTTHTSHSHVPSTYEIDEIVKLDSGPSTTDLTALQADVGEKMIFKGEALNTHAQASIDTVTVHSETSGFCASSETHSEQQSAAFTKTNLRTPVTEVNNNTANLEGTDIYGDQLINKTKEGMKVGPTVVVVEDKVTHDQNSLVGHLEVESGSGREVAAHSCLYVKEFLTEDSPLTLTSVEWDKEYTHIQGKYEEGVRHLKSWSYHNVSGSVIDPGISMLIALSVAVATSGMSLAAISTLKGVLVHAGFSTMMTKAITTSFSNGMNFHKTLEAMASSETVKAVAFSMLSAGAMYGLMGPVTAPGAEQAAEKAVEKTLEQSFTDCLKFSFTKAGVDATLKVAIYGENVGTAIKEGLISGAIDTAGSFAAGQIGKMYQKGELNVITHKAAHAAVGGLMGALISDDSKRGAISGAIGAVVAETIAETFLLNSYDVGKEVIEEATARDEILTKAEYTTRYKQKMHAKTDWAKLGAGVVTLLAGQDVEVSLKTATNALENNCLGYVVALATAVGSAWTVYDAYDTWIKEGPEAAVEKLIIDGAITVVGAKGVQLAGKGCVKLLSNAQVRELWAKYCADNPITIKLVSLFKGKAGTSQATNISKAEQKAFEGNLGDPKNVAQYEKYKADLRRDMDRPHSLNSPNDLNSQKLAEKLEWLHKDNSMTGSGSTAAAVRHEILTGELVGGRSHTQKAKDGANFLIKWLKNNPTASSVDKTAAENMLRDLQDALRTKK